MFRLHILSSWVWANTLAGPCAMCNPAGKTAGSVPVVASYSRVFTRMLTGYPFTSSPVSTASPNLPSHLAASAHTAHLADVEFGRSIAEVTRGPEPSFPWRHVDQQTHVVRPPHPLAEPRTPQRTRGLPHGQGFGERLELLGFRHIG